MLLIEKVIDLRQLSLYCPLSWLRHFHCTIEGLQLLWEEEIHPVPSVDNRSCVRRTQFSSGLVDVAKKWLITRGSLPESSG